MTWSAPTWARMRAISSSMNEPIVQSRAQPQIRTRKLRMIAVPWSLCVTSGWNCTPQKFRAGACTAASGQLAERAMTCDPGIASMRSPWLIHTVCSPGRPAKSGLVTSQVISVRPNSRWSALTTLPPVLCAVTWMP